MIQTSNLIPVTSIDPNSVAFLQYTSGSTSEPKGVMITHSNLTHNEQIIARELQTTSDTICVSWLPQYHDVSFIFFVQFLLLIDAILDGSHWVVSRIAILWWQWVLSLTNFIS